MPLLAFDDVPILPYTFLNDRDRKVGGRAHQGGPLWPDWDLQTAARHCRCGQPIDDPPETRPIEETIDGPVAWAGAILTHFGHQIAEFSTRILPTLAEWPDATFVFAVRNAHGIKELANAPRYVAEILEWLGVPAGRVRIVWRPTLARRLLVAPQGEPFDPGFGRFGPEPDYLDALDALTRRRLGTVERRATMYVSRAGQTARFAGESELELALARAGVEVFRPEDFPLAEQLRRYAGADRLIFAEGSALHGLQLLGRGLGEVEVIARRAGLTMARAPILARSRNVAYHDFGIKPIQFVHVSGKPVYNRSLALLDEARLVQGLEGLGIPVARDWNSDRFRVACEHDVREWLERSFTLPHFANTGSPDSMRAGLVACGFGHLTALVDAAEAALKRTGEASG